MSQLDWFIVAFAALLAVVGYRQGLIVGVLSFAGFVAGAFIGSRVGTLLLPQGSASPYAPAFGLVGGLIFGGVLAGALEGLGFLVRRRLFFPGARSVDGLLGGAFGAALALGIVWIVAALAAQSSSSSALRADIQRSAILRKLNEVLPPSGPILGALARLDPIPSITGPAPGVAAPESRVARTPGVRRASGSVVRVVGTACGLAIEGSGWVAAPGLVVTNAHVVAGEQDTSAQVHGEAPSLPARAVVFDPERDIAVLHVPELQEPSLPLASAPEAGLGGAILGYPENGPFDAQPARIGRTQTVITDNAYGQGPVSRLLTPLRGVVRPGNSGGPVVDAAGRVLTTVFAGTVGGRSHGGYGVADETVQADLAVAAARVRSGAEAGTGPCAAE